MKARDYQTQVQDHIINLIMEDKLKKLNNAIHDLNKGNLTVSEMDFALGAQFAMHYILKSSLNRFLDGGNTMADKLKSQLNK